MFDSGLLVQVLLRLLLLCTVALLVVRIMGNRTVGQLSPFDFVIMVGIGDIIVAGTMDQNPTLETGIESLIVLLVLQQLIGYLALKNTTLRKWFEGTPVTLVQKGQLIKENFAKTHFNYDDLRQELHKKGLDMSDLTMIESARLESCGEFTMIRTPENEPLTKKDFESYIKSVYDNPLSLAGEKLTKFEQFMDNVQFLAENLRQQQGLNKNDERINVDKDKEFH
ncbi:DUF421 domain-containing protein [Sporomusa acidovorans]|uniref:YetF C-terminal domain-containing protein n=2 Tax=Sporomusa TaxID=2375 RepID=A0ABZ3J3I0_SPOA4|nr:YetF domain-containing protein [Sporomusa acidovorans]OZC20914.1 hypothetical protein SPACI_22770 [Sporomusa acidovorans DSM 3132]SDE60930.1 Uncharacterized membrane protein YcaP, DUF421 family [Sporomusa acidovorans]